MRRFLLSIVAFALALTASAQASVQQQQEKYRVVECNPIMVKHSGAVSKAPKKIASNQRWVGYYSSDALADYGMGVPSYPGENKVAIYLTESILKPYIGMKIVGIRFGLCADIGQSSVFLSQIKDGYPDQVLTYTYVQNGVTGWNEETFPKPYTIKAGEELVAGFEYTQYDDDIKLVALVNKYNRKDVLDNRIENSIGLSLSEATSIQTLDADENAVEVARYNAAGQRINGKQKGLNIVKLSNGTTLKVVVK